MKVLIVEDDFLVNLYLQRIFGKKGFDVISVTSVKEAVSLINDHDFDIVITDLRLPGEDGLDLVRSIPVRAERPGMIVCSAYITPDLSQELADRGVMTLRKPFTKSELEQKLELFS